MRRLVLSLLVLPVALIAGTESHFDLLASFEPPGAAAEEGAVTVTFRALDPDLRLNESPAPHLELDLTQTLLVDRQAPPPKRMPTYDPRTAKYLDLEEPVRFPVALSPVAASGVHTVVARVVYFYCSVREAWCRRGTADVELTVEVP